MTSAVTSISSLLLPWAAPAGRLRGARMRGRLHQFHEVSDDILEDRRVQLVEDFLPLPLCDYEARLAEDGEMPRDRRPARMEVIGNLAGSPGPAAQEIEDVAPRLVSKRA